MTLASAASAGLAWFATEYRDTEILGATTAEALRQHTEAELRNYESTMEVLDSLQVTTAAIREDMAVLKYRLNIVRPADNAPHMAAKPAEHSETGHE